MSVRSQRKIELNQEKKNRKEEKRNRELNKENVKRLHVSQVDNLRLHVLTYVVQCGTEAENQIRKKN